MIRKATINDIYDIAEIKVNSWKVSYKNIFGQDFLNSLSVDYVIYGLEKSIKRNEFNGLVYTKNNKVLGFVLFGKVLEGDVKNYDGEIYSIYVSPDYLNKGIGSDLLKSTLNDFRMNNNKKIMLWVFKENISAQEFYLKHNAYKGEEQITGIGNYDVVEYCYYWNLNTL